MGYKVTWRKESGKSASPLRFVHFNEYDKKTVKSGGMANGESKIF